jgi:hypothetical protein
MNGIKKIALLTCLGLTVAAMPRAAVADEISARLDALEKENAALRARLNRLEVPRTAKLQQRPTDTGTAPALTSLSRPADSMAADLSYEAGPKMPSSPHFEIAPP